MLARRAKQKEKQGVRVKGGKGNNAMEENYKECGRQILILENK